MIEPKLLPYSVDPERAIRVLNEALDADPDAINEMFRYSVKVNMALANHLHMQVYGRDDDPETGEGGWIALRFMGLLNALFGIDERGVGYLCMHVDENGRIIKFDRTPQAGPEAVVIPKYRSNPGVANPDMRGPVAISSEDG